MIMGAFIPGLRRKYPPHEYIAAILKHLRNEEELKHGANNGLKSAIDFCEQVNKNHPRITYADLYQLAGVVAVEITGGPTVEFVPGRKDSLVSPREGRLPDAKQGGQHLKDIFYRMGLSDKEIVALSGAHTLGRAHPERSGFGGAWTSEPLKFDNSYFVELLEGETGGLLKLPTDKALLDDPAFHRYVELYAKDEDTFFKEVSGALIMDAFLGNLQEAIFYPETSQVTRITLISVMDVKTSMN